MKAVWVFADRVILWPMPMSNFDSYFTFLYFGLLQVNHEF